MMNSATLFFLFTFMVSLAIADHYETLGLSKDATTREIKKAYRRLSLKHHPDKAKPKDKEAAEKKFSRIAEAYETLSDEKRRSEYDNQEQTPGSDGHDFSQFFHQARRGPSLRRGDHHHFFTRGANPHMSQFSQGHPDVQFADDDITRIFAGMFGGGKRQARQPPSPPPSPPLYNPSDSTVQQFTGRDFHEVTRANRGDSVWLLHFYSASSHGCRALAPILRTLAASLKGLVRVGAVNCDQQAALCERMQVANTPTVKLLGPGEVQTFTAAGKLTQASLATAALRELPSTVVHLRREDHARQFFDLCSERATHGCVLLFTDKYDTPPLFKRLSSIFDKQLLLGEVRGSNAELASAFGVRRFPTLLYFRHRNAAPAEFNGPTKYAEVRQFLRSKVYR